MPEREFAYDWDDFESVRKLLYSSAGISMADSKFQLVYSRLARRLRALRLRSVNDYLSYLKSHGEEQEHFVNALTTNLTAFFREPHHFDVLARFLREKAGRGRRFTLWCAAASTGEEPYSMALVALETLGDSPPVSIIATDIDSQVLQQARQGVYAAERCKGLSDARLKQFCLRGRAGTTTTDRVSHPESAIQPMGAAATVRHYLLPQRDDLLRQANPAQATRTHGAYAGR